MSSTAPETDDLEKCLKQITATCREIPKWQWPAMLVCKTFNAHIDALYKKHLAPERPSPIFWDAIVAVDHRWPGLHLEKQLNQLVDRVVKYVPCGPVTQLVKAASAPGVAQEQKARIEALAALIRGGQGITGAYITYRDLLIPLASPEFKLAIAKPKQRTETEHAAFLKDSDAFISYAAFADVQRLHLLWLRNYDAGISSFAQWIAGFQNDQLTQKLLTILSGEIFPAEELKKLHKKRLARERVAKSRLKKSAE
ncbi:MAG: hypothetical protein JWL90_4742 [Chthoniobacteraceae bacterium]|nr:hypothetical protein [Chthoniobacteraceae bacterium]